MLWWSEHALEFNSFLQCAERLSEFGAWRPMLSNAFDYENFIEIQRQMVNATSMSSGASISPAFIAGRRVLWKASWTVD